ncbi:MAG: hypothetical protein ACPGO3_09960 [Magnetospiraceae bacterium]
MAENPTIERYRGDTVAVSFTFTESDGSAIDLTGGSLLLTVNSEKGPTDTANQLWQIVGTLTDATTGKAEFTPSAVQADLEPKTYYYDIQFTDSAGAIRTMALGKFVVTQDITK